jgi:hypothetical protein
MQKFVFAPFVRRPAKISHWLLISAPQQPNYAASPGVLQPATRLMNR